MRILLVDDDLEYLEATARLLREEGQVVSCSDPRDALQHIHEAHLILTDYEMGPLNGNEVLAFARESGALAPVLLVTGRMTKQTAITAVNQGVFRIIEKPFELSALKQAVEEARKEYVRRLALAKIQFEQDIRKSLPEFRFDEQTLTVHFKKHRVRLTEIEFRILTLLLQAGGNLVSKEYLVARIWGGRTLSGNLFVTHLGNLRKKLPFLAKKIRSVRGRGYSLNLSQRTLDPAD